MLAHSRIPPATQAITCVNRIETMYGRSDVNEKVERGTTFTFTHGFSHIVSIVFTHVKPVKVYICTHLRASLREDQAEVTHAISPFSMKLCQVEGTTQ